MNLADRNVWRLLGALWLACALHAGSRAQLITVAPADAAPELKRTATLVCDGVNDEQELAQSLNAIAETTACVNNLDHTISNRRLHGPGRVTWLPGHYKLGATLEFPPMADLVLDAEGTRLIYAPRQGDAVVLHGMFRCRIRLGVIETNGDGAALRVQPDRRAPLALMSIVSFMGLNGIYTPPIMPEEKKNADFRPVLRGTGLWIDKSTCTNRFEGTDIQGFDKGIYVSNAPGTKIDTNWFWMSYIRTCNTCIQEEGEHVDGNMWFVNVDANGPNGVGVRTAASTGCWQIIMGTWRHEGKNMAVILDPGARGNTMLVQPPLEHFRWQNLSGNQTNRVESTGLPASSVTPPPAAPPAP
jgi:hypothetical protein